MKTFAVLVKVLILNRPVIVRKVVAATDESAATNHAAKLTGGRPFSVLKIA